MPDPEAVDPVAEMMKAAAGLEVVLLDRHHPEPPLRTLRVPLEHLPSVGDTVCFSLAIEGRVVERRFVYRPRVAEERFSVMKNDWFSEGYNGQVIERVELTVVTS